MSSASPIWTSVLLGDRVEDELRAHRLLGALAQLGGELLAGLALRLEVAVEQRVVVAEGVHDVVLAHSTSEVTADSGSGNSTVAMQVLEQLVPRLRALLEDLDAAQPGTQVGTQFVDGVELAGQLGELVVDLG